MGVKLISKEVEWYEPDGYKDDPKPPKFKVKRVGADVYSEISLDGDIDSEGNTKPSARSLKKAILTGLLDWENVGDGPMKKSSIFRLPPALYLDVALHIIEISSLTEEEAKN